MTGIGVSSGKTFLAAYVQWVHSEDCPTQTTSSAAVVAVWSLLYTLCSHNAGVVPTNHSNS